MKISTVNFLDKLQSKNLKLKFQSRDIIFGAWVSFEQPSITEIFSLAGFDFIGIDMEHAPISLSSAQKIFAFAQAKNVCCLPRPVSHNNDIFKPLLDSGANGLITPMVESKSEVKRILDFIKYPPVGKRTFGLNRAQGYGFHFSNYVTSWNENSIFIPQIESKKGVDNIEEIISNPDVDGVMIGPYDLSGSYGVPGDLENNLVKEACKKVIDKCKKYGKSCGTQLSNPNEISINNAIKEGYNFIILSSDLFILWNWSENMKSIMQNFK